MKAGVGLDRGIAALFSCLQGGKGRSIFMYERIESFYPVIRKIHHCFTSELMLHALSRSVHRSKKKGQPWRRCGRAILEGIA